MSLTSFANPYRSENLTEINRPWRVFLDILYSTAVYISLIIVGTISADDPLPAILSGIVTSAILLFSAILALRGSIKWGSRIHLVVLLFYFITSSFLADGVSTLHALLAFSMISTALIHAGPFYEERFSYFVLVGAVIVIVTSFFITGTGGFASDPGAYRTVGFIFFTIQFFILTYVIIEQFSTFSLVSKFIISVILLAFVSILVTIAAVSYTINQSATEDVVQDLQIIADSSALELGEFIAREISVLEAFNGNRILQEELIAENLTSNNLNETEIEAQLRRRQVIWRSADLEGRSQLLNDDVQTLLEDFDQFVPNELSLVVTDQYGQLLATTGNPDQYYYGEEPWFFRAYAAGFGSRYVSDPYVLDRETVDPLEELRVFEQDDVVLGIDIAIPLLTFPENRTRPVAVGTLKTTLVVNGILKDLSLNIQGSRVEELDLLVGDNVLHVHDAEISRPEEPTFDLNILEVLRQDDFALAEYEGTNSYVVASSITSSADLTAIDNLGWTMFAYQSEGAALAIITEQQRVQILLGLVILLGGSLAALAVGRIVVTPITELAEFAEQIAQGERNIRANIRTQDEIATLAHSFNEMVIQIEGNERTLEQRVMERTRVLETSARIGRSLSTIVELDALILAIVEQLKQAFDYYHVHVYIPSKNGEYLELVGGSGEIGQQLLARNHKIPIESGLVGRAAASKVSILEPDVSQAENWRPNELLPETQSELAVPIVLNEQLLGVLDIQNDVVNSLQKEDVDAVEAIAYQIAVAIQNAQLYEEAQREAAREQLINQINQKIVSTSDMETAMKVALREIGQVIEGAQAVVSLKGKRENGHD